MSARSKGFKTKAEARLYVWNILQAEEQAAFPFPPHGRIPNFKGAKLATERLFELPLMKAARCIKVNPDAPQRFVREEALRRGKIVYMPSPRLRDGFKKLDPHKIPSGRYEEASSLRTVDQWADDVPIRQLPAMDVIITGSVAVTRSGHRCGKGHGYGDIEFAILRELGHPVPPVVTTVHPLQIVESFPIDPNDLPVSFIVTPEDIIEVENPPPAPTGIDWERLPPNAFEEMPVLAELRQYKPS